jgi:hypothetical protein
VEGRRAVGAGEGGMQSALGWVVHYSCLGGPQTLFTGLDWRCRQRRGARSFSQVSLSPSVAVSDTLGSVGFRTAGLAEVILATEEQVIYSRDCGMETGMGLDVYEVGCEEGREETCYDELQVQADIVTNTCMQTRDVPGMGDMVRQRY